MWGDQTLTAHGSVCLLEFKRLPSTFKTKLPKFFQEFAMFQFLQDKKQITDWLQKNDGEWSNHQGQHYHVRRI